MVHVKVGEADPVFTPKGLSVTGFMFEVDGVSFSVCQPCLSVRSKLCVATQDNDNAALAPLTNALAQIEVSNSQVDFSAVGFSVNLMSEDCSYQH